MLSFRVLSIKKLIPDLASVHGAERGAALAAEFISEVVALSWREICLLLVWHSNGGALSILDERRLCVLTQ